MSPVNFQAAVFSYYLGKELLESLPDTSINARRKKGLEEDVQFIVDQLHLLFQDYLPLACVAEARHGRAFCEKYIPELNEMMDGIVFSAQMRDYFQTTALELNPKKFMPKVKALFDLHWGSGYGGHSWGVVAEAYLRKNSLDKEAWVQQVADLAHNNGPAFDKAPKILEFSGFAFMIQMSFRSSIGAVETMKSLVTPVTEIFLPSAEHWLLPYIGVPYLEEVVSFIGEDSIAHIPIKWGNKTVSDPMTHPQYEEKQKEKKPEPNLETAELLLSALKTKKKSTLTENNTFKVMNDSTNWKGKYITISLKELDK